MWEWKPLEMERNEERKEGEGEVLGLDECVVCTQPSDRLETVVESLNLRREILSYVYKQQFGR